MILNPVFVNSFENFNEIFSPYLVQSLVPTIAIPLLFNIFLFPSTYNFNGGLYTFLNFCGYSFDSIDISSISIKFHSFCFVT